MMEEEEGESTTPFWIQTPTDLRRNRRPLFLNSGVLIFTLCITFSLLILFLVPPIPSLSPQISRPNLFKKSWDSLNITLVLLALIFGLLSRNRNHDPTDDSDHLTDPKVRNESQKSNQSVPSSWYEFSDPTAVINLERAHTSYPDLCHLSPDDYHRSEKVNPEEQPKEATYDDASAKETVNIVNNLNTGSVINVGKGIACIRGLGEVTEGEIVEFDEGTIGIVVKNSDSNENVNVVLMGDGLMIREGSCVNATGKIAQVPKNEVINSLDKPINLNSAPEIKFQEMPPTIRRRTRRTVSSKSKKEKLSEEMSGLEPSDGKLNHRRTKSSGLESLDGNLKHRRTRSSGSDKFGTVLLVGKGVARIYGFDEVSEGEIVEFEEGTIGIVTNSESTNNIGVVLMGDGLTIQEGTRVKATGKIVQIPVTEAFLGRVINSLNKPIDCNGKIFASELMEETEITQMPPAVRRKTTESIAHKGKFSEESEQLSHRKMKRTHEESKIPKVEANEEIVEIKEYESSPEMFVQDAPTSPPLSERKRGGGNTTRDFLTSLRNRKKKQKQKSGGNFEELLESQPPSPPPPPSAIQSFFSSKKGKSKKFITVPPPPPPPQPHFTASREQKSTPVTAPVARRPPLPTKSQSFLETESVFTGAESPLHPIPPPPPPFTMPGWKFAVRGDYVNIRSVNSSRSVSPEPEEVDLPMSSGGDGAAGGMFCPSPDVNSKADMFIAKFRAGLKLQKMNSMRQTQGVGLSNLGPVSTLDQARV